MAIRNTRALGWLSNHNYGVTNLNDGHKSVLTLLNYTDKDNFDKKRRELIFGALDIKHPHNKKKAIESYLNFIKARSHEKGIPRELFEKLGYVCKPVKDLTKLTEQEKIDMQWNPKPLELDVEDLTKKLLDKKLTPYEVIGKIKDDNKKDLPASFMKKYWAELSVIEAIDSLDSLDNRDNREKLSKFSNTKGFDETLQKESIKAKILALEKSVNDIKNINAPENPKSKLRYVENYAHIRNSSGKNANWAEIITNLNPQQGSLVRNLISIDKNHFENFDKAKITKEYLWPKQSENEIENRRLNRFLEKLGSRPSGRKGRFEKMFIEIEPEINPQSLNPQSLNPQSLKEDKQNHREELKLESILKRNKKIEDNLVKFELFVGKNPKQIQKLNPKLSSESKTSKKELRELKELEVEYGVWKDRLWELVKDLTKQSKDIHSIKKLETPKAQEIWEKYKIIFDEHCQTILKNFIRKIRSNVPVDQDKIFELLESTKNFEGEYKRDSYTTFLTAGFNNIEKKEVLDKLKASKLIDLLPIRQSISGDIIEEKKGQYKDLRTPNLFYSLTKNKKYLLDKEYGKELKLTPLYIASQIGTEEELETLCKEHQKTKLSLSKEVGEDKYTPLHTSPPHSTKILLKYGANPNARNSYGKKTYEFNIDETSKTLIIKFLVNKKISRDEEIDI